LINSNGSYLSGIGKEATWTAEAPETTVMLATTGATSSPVGIYFICFISTGALSAGWDCELAFFSILVGGVFSSALALYLGEAFDFDFGEGFACWLD